MNTQNSQRFPETPTIQRGFSLIELMVAMIIATVIGIGLVQIFASTRAAFNTNMTLAHAQENSRFALDFIQRDLRMAAHLGTRNEQSAKPGTNAAGVANMLYNHLAPLGTPAVGNDVGKASTAPWWARLDVPVEAYEFTGTGIGTSYNLPDPPVAAAAGSWTPALPTALAAALSPAPLAGSDILVVRYLSAESVSLVNTEPRADNFPFAAGVDPFTPGTGQFFWTTPSADPAMVNFIKEGGIYAFSNSGDVSLFQVTGGVVYGSPSSAIAAPSAGLNNWDWICPAPAPAPPALCTAKNPMPNPSVARTAVRPYEDVGRYGKMLPVHQYRMTVYYVAIGADGEPALWRRTLAEVQGTGGGTFNDAEELVPGVESLQLRLGVVNVALRQSDQPLTYMTANQVAAGGWHTGANACTTNTTTGFGGLCWADVVSVQAGLLMRSSMSIRTGAVGLEVIPRTVAGAIMTPAAGDRRVRNVYETQVGLRNRSRG